MNIIASEKGQGVYMIPKQSISGISYGDYFSYAEAGQLWLFGCSSDNESKCGLSSSASYGAWASSHAIFSARLAYYGPLNRVTTSRFKQLAS